MEEELEEEARRDRCESARVLPTPTPTDGFFHQRRRREVRVAHVLLHHPLRVEERAVERDRRPHHFGVRERQSVEERQDHALELEVEISIASFD